MNDKKESAKDVIDPDYTDSFINFGGDMANKMWGSSTFATQFTNAHVAVCVSVLADAVSQLPADIIRVETSQGTRTEIDDNAHPANFIFKGPNADMTYTDFMQGIVQSLLIDGNVYITIDPIFGGYELYLRDPLSVKHQYSEDEKRIVSYKIDTARIHVVYPRERMIHMKELDARNPLKGKSRLESLRQELQMDEYIKEFNTNFFKQGGVVGWMYTPDKILNPTHLKQIGRAIRDQTAGVANMFKLFINPFPGKLTTPDQKHKDIAFLELLKYIRETINAVFKVPPYKAGILEYANYANSTQQQESFWTDGVMPLLRRIQDIINKDFIWKYFDENHELKFNTSNIAALQGDPEIRMKVNTQYVKYGILTIDEVRADLDREPLDAETSQTSNEEDKYTRVYDTLFQEQQNRIIDKLEDASSGLTALLPYVGVDDIFNIEDENKVFQKTLASYIKDTFSNVGETAFNSISTPTVFDINSDDVKLDLRTINMKHDILNEKTYNILEQLLSVAVSDGMQLKELKDRIKDKLSWKYAQQCAKEIVPNIARRATRIAEGQKLIDEAIGLASKENR